MAMPCSWPRFCLCQRHRKAILVVLTIPITIFNAGLFLLVINALIIMMVDYFCKIDIDGFWWALAFSLILSIFNSMFAEMLKTKNR